MTVRSQALLSRTPSKVSGEFIRTISHIIFSDAVKLVDDSKTASMAELKNTVNDCEGNWYGWIRYHQAKRCVCWLICCESVSGMCFIWSWQKQVQHFNVIWATVNTPLSRWRRCPKTRMGGFFLLFFYVYTTAQAGQGQWDSSQSSHVFFHVTVSNQLIVVPALSQICPVSSQR